MKINPTLKRSDTTFNDLIKNTSISEETVAQLKEAVSNGKNVVIFGGIGAGKTTVMEALLLETARNIHKKNVYVCEFPEITNKGDSFVTLDNSVSNDSMASKVKGALKMAPDYIFVDEVRDGDTVNSCNFAYLAGVPFSIVTHSHSKENAILRLETMSFLEKVTKEDAEGLDFLKDTIFVQVERDSLGKRFARIA